MRKFLKSWLVMLVMMFVGTCVSGAAFGLALLAYNLGGLVAFVVYMVLLISLVLAVVSMAWES